MEQKVQKLLNRMIAIHARSLPVYLTYAKPWSSTSQAEPQEVLAMIAEDQHLTVERLADEVQEQGGTLQFGAFPTEFTGFHDVSIDFAVAECARRQAADIVEIDGMLDELARDAALRPLAEETLGAAKGHLETLNELMQNVC